MTYTVPSPHGYLFHCTHGWQVWTTTDETLVLDVRTWPPGVAMRVPGHTQAAARCRSGRWLFHQKRDEAWVLVVREGETEHVLPVPLEEPDWNLVKQDDYYARCRQRLAHMCAIGDHVLLVPVLVGLGDGRRPMLGTGDGAWRAVDGLAVPDHIKGDIAVASCELGDGGSVLLWDRVLFECVAGSFVRSFDAPPLYSTWSRGMLVPTGPDGLFAVGWVRRDLIELHRGRAPRVHNIEGESVHELCRGPGGTVIVGHTKRTMIYDPSAATVRDVPRELLADRATISGWSDAGGMLLERGDRTGARWLEAIPAERLLAEPAHPADRAPEAPVIERVIGGRAASRPRVAADAGSSLIVILDGVRAGVRDLDDPIARHIHDCELVAVVARDGEVLTLDAEGTLFRQRVARIATGLGDAITTGARDPLSLVATRGGALVLAAEGVVRIDGDRTTRLPFDAALAGAEGPTGAVLLVGPGPRAAVLRGDRLIDVAAPASEVHAVIAIAPDEWLGLSARALVRFDGVKWHEVRPLAASGNHLLGLPDGNLVLASSLHGVGLMAPPQYDKIENLVNYGETFYGDQPLEVVGLAAIGNRVLVGLNRDNGNIITLGAQDIHRFDPHPGQVRDSWIFIGHRRILWA